MDTSSQLLALTGMICASICVVSYFRHQGEIQKAELQNRREQDYLQAILELSVRNTVLRPSRANRNEDSATPSSRDPDDLEGEAENTTPHP